MLPKIRFLCGVRCAGKILCVAGGIVLFATAVAAQSPPEVRRVLTALGAVGEEYREAMEDGRVVRPVEYEEAKAFVADVRMRLAALGIDATQLARIDAEIGAAELALERLDTVDAVVARLATARQQIVQATGVDEEVYPPNAPSMARGRSLFAEYCTTCHGAAADGRGPDAAKLTPPPSSFRTPDFMRGETPYDFFHVISLGRRNTAMPAWGEALSVQDRWDLVSFLWSVVPGERGIAEGQGVYLAQCAGCHNANGDGKGPFASELVNPVPDASSAQALAKKTDRQLYDTLSAGVPGRAMPGFARTLSDDERWKAVSFLRLLSLGGPGSKIIAGNGQPGNPQSRHFGGLLSMLAGVYGLAVKDGDIVAVNEYEEARSLAVQVSTHIGSVAEQLAANSPDAAKQAIALAEQIVAVVGAHGSGDVLAGQVRELQRLLETLPDAVSATAGAAASERVPEAVLDSSRQLLSTALAAYRRGDPQAAALVSDAYFEFEPLERRLGARSPRLKSQVEERFVKLRQQVRAPHNESVVAQTVSAIERDYAEVLDALQPRGTSYGLLLESAGIILREGFEAALVIGALAAYVLRAGQGGMRRFVYTGTAAGLVASVITGFVMEGLLNMYPSSADALEGLTMLLAAVVLFWVSYWLISKAEADRWQQYIKGRVQRALSTGSGVALAGAAFLAVYREGFETVLFYKALYASAAGQSSVVALGIGLGTVALVFVYMGFRRFQARIPIAKFFAVTGTFLYAMAAIFAGQGVNELQEVNWISTTPVAWVPTIAHLGIFPSLETLAAQGVFVAMFAYALFALWRRTRATAEPARLLEELQRLRHSVEALREVVSEGSLPEGSATQSSLKGLVDRVDRTLSELHAAAHRVPPNGNGARHSA